MKKILLIALAVLVAAGLVTFMVIKQQSGYTKVYTTTIARQDLTSVVSGTGQIKPKTYMNVGATSLGRITRFYVKEGDHVKKGEIVATLKTCSSRPRSTPSRRPSPPPRPISLLTSRRKRPPRPTWHTPRPTWNRKSSTGSAPRRFTMPASWPSRTTTPRRRPTTWTWPPGAGGCGSTRPKPKPNPPADTWKPRCHTAGRSGSARKNHRRCALRRHRDQRTGARGRDRGRRHPEHRRLHADDAGRHERGHRRSEGGRDGHRERPARPACGRTVDALPGKIFKGT